MNGLQSAGQKLSIVDKETHVMSTVPMTSFAGVEERSPQEGRDKSLDYKGPYGGYMFSLVRLGEAVQSLGKSSLMNFYIRHRLSVVKWPFYRC